MTAKCPAGTATLSLDSSKQHAETIIDLIQRSVALAGFSVKETNLVVCAEGPGSFTGLRLAYATAKGIQLAAHCPLFPVKGLGCYAQSAFSWPGAVIAVLDAKKNRFYIQIFRKGEAVTEALDIGESEVLQYLDAEERILVTGPDAVLFTEQFSNANPGFDICAIPSGLNGISEILAGIAEINFPLYTEVVPDHAGPVYVRKSDAETNNERK